MQFKLQNVSTVRHVAPDRQGTCLHFINLGQRDKNGLPAPILRNSSMFNKHYFAQNSYIEMKPNLSYLR